MNLTTDPDNCTECGAACGGGRDCIGGACQCPMGLTQCNTQCTNLLGDPANCGACGNSCNGGTCQGGGCTCPSGKSLCNQSCADYSSDLKNCGGCGKVCAPGQTCGATGCTCAAGQKACGAAGCIDISRDNLNCGDCGHLCSTGEFCSNGTCTAAITCGTAFNPPSSAGCGYMPLLVANCGAQTQIGSPSNFSGTAAASTWAVLPYTPNPTQAISVIGTVTSGNSSNVNVDVALRNAVGSYVSSASFAAPGSVSQPNLGLGGSGSPYACAEPVDLGVYTTAAQGANYNLTVTRFARERFNTGSSDLTTATPPSLPMQGVTCDQGLRLPSL